MKPWTVVGRARIPDGTELTLTHHDGEYILAVDGQSLMSSRMHFSEEALATFGCDRARTQAQPRVLIGGLGMGFTVRAALDVLPRAAEVVVAELVPAVVEWNRGVLGPLAGHPLDDPRVRVAQEDVAVTMRSSPGSFDAVLLDTDNGPEGLTALNKALYGRDGVALARASLTPDGVLAIWSAASDLRGFGKRLTEAGFSVRHERVSARPGKRGSRHTVLVAQRSAAR